jgi:ribokinase
MLNLAPARPVSPASLARLAYLSVNETEAEFLTGLKVASERDVETAAKALLAKGPKTVVLTLGPRGAYVAGAGVRALVPGFAVAAVDTTAAGDVHCGALAVALVEGRPLLEAVRFANAAAALSVTKLGAQPSAPRREEVEAMLSKG